MLRNLKLTNTVESIFVGFSRACAMLSVLNRTGLNCTNLREVPVLKSSLKLTGVAGSLTAKYRLAELSRSYYTSRARGCQEPKGLCRQRGKIDKTKGASCNGRYEVSKTLPPPNRREFSAKL